MGAPRSTGGARTRSPVESVLELQASAGNAAVTRLLRQATAAPAAPPRHRLLKAGSTGNDVYLAKIKLNAAGADPALEMGFSFDTDMQDAVRKFQTERKLQVDGQIGQQTWAALDTLTSGRSPDNEAEFDALAARVTEAHARFDRGDLKGAGQIYDQLDADPHVTVDVRSFITFRRAHIAQANGDFTTAISLYTEYLGFPHLTTTDRRETLQRIREARLEQPPGPLESDLNKQVIDPGDLPEPGAGGPHRLLKAGSTGNDVYLAKIKLNAAGADPALEMGFSFDQPMQDAVRKFQTERKLQVDGEIGQQTWAALDTLTAGRTPGNEAEFDALAARVTEAHARFDRGDLKGAGQIYDELDADPRVTVDVRSFITFRRGHIAQAEGRFTTAISLYTEYLAFPQLSTTDRRETLQRIREARLEQPPGPLESDLNKQVIDPGDLPDPGAGGPHRLLKLGATGNDVYLAKIKLNAAGADPSLESGFTFDGEMQNAVRRFQTERKLQVDGQIGQQTWAALDTLTAGRTPGNEAEFDALIARVTEAHERFDRGDLKGAGTIYDELYADPRVTVDVRSFITFRRGHIAQAEGRFTTAISLYTEYLAYPRLTTTDRRETLQRIREARLEQPPGPLESDLNKEVIDPDTLPAPGA